MSLDRILHWYESIGNLKQKEKYTNTNFTLECIVEPHIKLSSFYIRPCRRTDLGFSFLNFTTVYEFDRFELELSSNSSKFVQRD